ncbi:glutamate ABC transporter substrate-binding protein [Dermatophilaceae bacterium Sec6.4]
MNISDRHIVSRRTLVSGVGIGSIATLLAACGGSSGGKSSAAGGSGSAYDKIIAGGPVASAAAIAASPWAAAVKKNGVLRVGATETSPLFSMKSLSTGELTGFDAGLSQLLARYITGKSAPKDLTKVTVVSVDTRESLLQNGTVDAVFATYSITPARAKKVAFAGPYYESGDAIMVKADNNDIKTVADLAGKTVVTESGSTAALDIKKRVPTAKLLLLQQDAECVAALQQGRADAYVLDQGILISDASTNKKVKVVGQPFTKEPYGIGLPLKDPSAKKFVDAFLQEIYKNGDWAKLWKATIGTVVSGAAPATPTLGSVTGA